MPRSHPWTASGLPATQLWDEVGRVPSPHSDPALSSRGTSPASTPRPGTQLPAAGQTRQLRTGLFETGRARCPESWLPASRSCSRTRAVGAFPKADGRSDISLGNTSAEVRPKTTLKMSPRPLRSISKNTSEWWGSAHLPVSRCSPSVSNVSTCELRCREM